DVRRPRHRRAVRGRWGGSNRQLWPHRLPPGAARPGARQPDRRDGGGDIPADFLEAPPPLRGRSATRSVDGWGVWRRLRLPSLESPWGGITPHPALRADLPLKGGGATSSKRDV